MTTDRTTLLDLLVTAALDNMPDAWGPEQHPLDDIDERCVRDTFRRILEEAGVNPDA